MRFLRNYRVVQDSRYYHQYCISRCLEASNTFIELAKYFKRHWLASYDPWKQFWKNQFFIIFHENFFSKILHKKWQKIIFSKIVFKDDMMPKNVFLSILGAQWMYLKPPNTLVYNTGDNICHFVRHGKFVKITIFTPFLYTPKVFSLKWIT